VFLCTLIACSAAFADILPTRGTFKGIYHKGIGGVGWFKFFIVPKDLTPLLDPYDGKYIELEVLDGIQPMNPGPAIIQKLGKIVELPTAPIKVAIDLVSIGGDGRQRFDIVCSFGNITKEPVQFNAGDFAVRIVTYGEPRSDAERFFRDTGYTYGQFGRALPAFRRTMFHPRYPGSNCFYAGQVRLLPSESAPFVWHDWAPGPGQYEIELSLRYRSKPGDDGIPVKAWQSLDATQVREPIHRVKESDLATQTTVEEQSEEWIHLSVRLFNPAEEKRDIFVRQSRYGIFLPGLIQAFDEHGQAVDIRVRWFVPDGPWVRRSIDSQGITFRFAVRHAKRFAQVPIKRITFWTVADRGLEKSTLLDDLDDRTLAPLPPWGQPHRGHRCRIRPAKPRYVAGEKIRFFFQAGSLTEERRVLWIDEGKREENLLVEIDGERTNKIGATSLTDGHVYSFPFEAQVEMAWDVQPEPGRHTLRVTVVGSDGTYEFLDGRKVKKFKGELVSNEAEFFVVQKESEAE